MRGDATCDAGSKQCHAGLYYTPGSPKALLCVRGREQLYHYCGERGISHRRRGKLIVAAADDERPKLQHYFDTAQRNGLTAALAIADDVVAQLGVAPANLR